jgi:beta-galactosidase
LPPAVTSAIESATGDEVLLTFSWVQRRATAWAGAGHLVAWDQVVVKQGRRPVAAPRPRRARAVAVDDVLAGGPELTLWRAAVDNDGFKLQPVLGDGLEGRGPALWRWLHYGLADGVPEGLVRHRQRVTRADDGSLVVEHDVELDEALADPPRVGAVLTLPDGFDQVAWYGRGPHECYPDRQRSALVGVWTGEVDELPYLVPQEYGLRTDCRWMTVSDGERTLAIEPLRPRILHVGVTRHSASELFEARDQTELPASTARFVHIDVAHRGLGTASCGPDVLDRYRIPAGRHRFRYRLSAWSM